MSADQIIGWSIAALAAGVLVGIHLCAWTDARKKKRAEQQARYDAANKAYWSAIFREIDALRPARPLGDIPSVKRTRERIADAECRRLRAELDSWGDAS